MKIEQSLNTSVSAVPDPLNEGEYFFEGTEKLLEIWFESSSPDNKASLRDIERSEWELLLKNVNCAILSSITSDYMDSYLLSESSMFVASHRIILKTCGKTTLLEAVLPLLRLVKQRCGFDVIVDVFYSHKNYMRPDLQPETYRHFDQEVATLDTIFEDGAAYVLGRVNKDCWYVYTVEKTGVIRPDQTLEIMMMKVDPEVMDMFTQAYGLTAKQLTLKSGIADILPGAVIDDWLFEPCGYSMNALLPDGIYFTIHITPEEDFSYASFETNAPMRNYTDLIKKVLGIFKPKKFIVSLLANEDSAACDYSLKNENLSDALKRQEHQSCQLKNYKLNYTLYELPAEADVDPYK